MRVTFKDKNPYQFLVAWVALLIVAIASVDHASAQQLRVLHSFHNNTTDGASPETGVTFDSTGNLYGTTLSAGEFNQGTVWELSPKLGGGWSERTIHNFNNNGKDGYYSLARLIVDAKGDLFGTTFQGGANGFGTVYEMVPQSGGKWAERILYSFAGTATSGANPFGGLILDSKGNLYGTTELGGTGTNCGTGPGCGVVFKLVPKNGAWVQKALYSFGVSSTDGFFPLGDLASDAAGNLYGVAYGGGVNGAGMVFELSLGSDGSWVEKDLHDFNPSAGDGNEPLAGLTIDKAGNLYGTTNQGGAYNDGTVYEVTPVGGGNWTEAVIYSFGTNSGDGRNPNFCHLILDAAGNVYGTTTFDSGTVFELTPSSGGTWTESVLMNFSNTSVLWPYAGVTFDGKGNLYGTVAGLGAYFVGGVFEVVR